MKNFKNKFSFEERKGKTDLLVKNYPDKIPVIFEPVPNCKLKLKDIRYLVGDSKTFGEFLFSIRQACKLTSNTALFCYVGAKEEIPVPSQLMSQLYKEHKDEDGFLYVQYSEENTFGYSK